MITTNKTKSELLEIIKQKEDEIIDLKNNIQQLEKCKRYDDVTDEIKDVYDKLVSKGFKSDEAIEITQTMISSGHIDHRAIPGYRPYVSYR